MSIITELSLVCTPPSAAKRDGMSIACRRARAKAFAVAILDRAECWAEQREDGETYWDFEETLRTQVEEFARASVELMLASANAETTEELAARCSVGEQHFRQCPAESRSFNTWFGVIRYERTYMRAVDGGPGFYPLDQDLGILSDRISPGLLSMAARLATRVSYGEAREILGWFVPKPPSTEVIEQTVLGLGHHTGAWFEQVSAPKDDGDVLVMLFDGKGVPTAKDSELEQRRGHRKDRPAAASPRHRGRRQREERGSRPRKKKGDKSKHAKMANVVVMYTLHRSGDLLLGPLNRRVYASFGPKRHAFEFARREAENRGFGPGTTKTIQVVTDGDRDLHRYTDVYFPVEEYAARVQTLDVMHALEKLWLVGRCRHKEGTPELAAWVKVQEDRFYDDRAEEVVADLREWLESTPKRGPGNKGRRKRLTDTIRYLDYRLAMMNYGTLRRRDLEVGSGQVEGAVNYVVARRCDHGGMRWIKERAQAVLQLRCIDINGDWDSFTRSTLANLQAQARATGVRPRLQTQRPAMLPAVVGIEAMRRLRDERRPEVREPKTSSRAGTDMAQLDDGKLTTSAAGEIMKLHHLPPSTISAPGPQPPPISVAVGGRIRTVLHRVWTGILKAAA